MVRIKRRDKSKKHTKCDVVGRVESQVKADEMMVLTTGDTSAVSKPLKLSTFSVFYTE